EGRRAPAPRPCGGTPHATRSVMRSYDREELRHLDDSERFRDYEYLAEEFPGPNEQVVEPHLPPAESGRDAARVLQNRRGSNQEPARASGSGLALVLRRSYALAKRALGRS